LSKNCNKNVVQISFLLRKCGGEGRIRFLAVCWMMYTYPPVTN